MTAARIKDLSLQDVHLQFDLVRTVEPDFFMEWQIDLPNVSPLEHERLVEIQQDYLYQSEEVMHESAVKMVVVSPLFSLAGFYRPPFRIAAEKTIRIQSSDRGKVYRGVIDVLVLHRQLWALVVESKRNTFSLEVARPQVLSYMLANPVVDSPTFGLMTNGTNFRLVKLVGRKYGESDEFYLGNLQDMGRLLQVLKHIAQGVSSGDDRRNFEICAESSGLDVNRE